MKKIIILLLLIIYFIPIGILAYQSGDVNGDGRITASDYILIRKHLLSNPKLTGDALVKADVDGKNGVTVADYVMVRKIILGLITPTEVAPLYVITEDARYASYTNVASYDSSTLKYRIIDYQGYDYVLVWVADSLKQLNGALASSDALRSSSAETILANEINTYGYQNKGMIAINASFYSPTDSTNGSPNTGVVINHGKLAKNTNKESGALIGINSSGILKMYNNKSANDIINDGVRNTFVISGLAVYNKNLNEGKPNNINIICQIDKNNFAIIQGNDRVNAASNKLYNFVDGKCKEFPNLDGGGSRKLYYKNSSTSKMTKRSGGARIIPDMLYFVEQ